MLDQALDALKTYDWGADPNTLNPIDDAIVATHGDTVARRKLEDSLADLLKTEISRDAKDFVCRKLMVVATAASTIALAELLSQKDHSHMARYALERIPAAEAAAALRDALPNLPPELQIGVIGSLGVRRDQDSVPAIAGLLSASDPAVARAAAIALGDIRTASAAQALAKMGSANEANMAVADASLACAEGLLADGKKADALAIYKGYIGESQPKHVRLAATRGMLACAGKSE